MCPTLGEREDPRERCPAGGAAREAHAPPGDRRRRITHRALPLIAIATVALVVGFLVGAGGQSDAERAASGFTRAWARGDYRAMYDMLGSSAKRRTSFAAFERAYRSAAATATAVSVLPGKAHDSGNGARAPVAIGTRVFGTIRGRLAVPVDGDKVDWRPQLVFPGLASDERLTRRTVAPPRGRILSRDGRTLAEGPAGARTSPLGSLASSI